jgi:hypothetical protein
VDQKVNLRIKQPNIIIAIEQAFVSVFIKIKIFVFFYLQNLSDKQTRQGWRRNSKTLDSLRCGIHCTSSMKVDIARNDQISVQYYPTHYGHTAEPPLQAPSSTTNTNSTLGTINGELVEQSSVQQHTIPSIQTVVQAAVQQTQTTTDHCVRLQHQHHAQTSSIIINIAPVSLLYFSLLNFFRF